VIVLPDYRFDVVAALANSRFSCCELAVWAKTRISSAEYLDAVVHFHRRCQFTTPLASGESICEWRPLGMRMKKRRSL